MSDREQRDLTEALDHLTVTADTGDRIGIRGTLEDYATAIDAARKWDRLTTTRPNYEAALQTYDAASQDHADEVAFVKAIVDAALEDTPQ